MSPSPRLSDRLQTLPPALPSPADRFDLVRARVERRRNRRVAAATAAGIAVIATVAWSTSGGVPRGTTAPDPATSPPTATARSTTAPGATEVTRVGTAIDEAHTGTTRVSLGAPPAAVSEVEISLQCLTAGTLTYPDGASLTCGEADPQTSAGADELTSRHVVDLRPGQSSITITADPTVSWRIVASYVKTRITDWGVNSRGQTFGAMNDHGTPDLVSVMMEDGYSGYVYADDLEEPAGIPQPTSPDEVADYVDATQGRTFDLPAYESDGVTRIGTFTVG